MIGPQSLNSTATYTAGPLKDSAKTTITTFTDTDVFAWTIWAGDGTTALATGAGTLQSPTSAALVDFTVLKSQLTTIDPGTYDLIGIVNPGTDDAVWIRERIQFTAAPGSGTADPTYGTYDDMEVFAPWIGGALSKANQSNAAEQRAKARQWIDSCIMSRAERDLESQYSRHGAVLYVDPIVPTAGVDLGPTWGPSILPDTTMQTQLAVIQGYLDANQLMTGAIDNGMVREIAARYAVYLVCDAQIGKANETPYQELASQFRRKAIAMMSAWTAKIDTDADGVADYELRP